MCGLTSVSRSGGIDVDSQNAEIVRSLYKAYVAGHRTTSNVASLTVVCGIDSRGNQHLGPEEVASYLQGWLASSSDESLEATGFYDAGTTVVVEGVMRGTNDDRWEPSRRRVASSSFRTARSSNLEDGLVSRYRAYADFTNLLAQLGLQS